MELSIYWGWGEPVSNPGEDTISVHSEQVLCFVYVRAITLHTETTLCWRVGLMGGMPRSPKVISGRMSN